ncbi:MAG: hypothetical protein HY420_00160 [Candidatus Kerfeldbacteria bacterium]|nr:hypothetical protein [Candidatus Kerfeldbacteria bacterium]
MKKITLVFILTAVFIMMGALAYFLISKNGGPLQPLVDNSSNNANNTYSSNQSSLSEVSLLDDLGEPHLSAVQAEDFKRRLVDWSLYSADPSVRLGGLDCGQSTRHDQLAALNHSDKRSYKLNGGLKIITTPNLYNWTAAELTAFTSDETVVCGAATMVPKAIVGDHILWWNACVGGAGPPANGSSDYEQTVRCLQAEEVVNSHFGISD